MTLFLSILIFIITFVKSVFDIFVSPYLFKKEILCKKTLEAVEAKRSREAKSTTLVFVFITIISAINIWDTSMNNSEKDMQSLQKRVTKIEDFLFPSDGGQSLEIQLNEIAKSINKLEKNIAIISKNKADQTELDRAIKILATLKNQVNTLQSKHQKTRMLAR